MGENSNERKLTVNLGSESSLGRDCPKKIPRTIHAINRQSLSKIFGFCESVQKWSHNQFLWHFVSGRFTNYFRCLNSSKILQTEFKYPFPKRHRAITPIFCEKISQLLQIKITKKSKTHALEKRHLDVKFSQLTVIRFSLTFFMNDFFSSNRIFKY